MASISRDPGGRRRILFIGADGKRRAVRLGKVPQRVADSICAKVESLAASARRGRLGKPETAAWVGQAGIRLVCQVGPGGTRPQANPHAPGGLGDVAHLRGYVHRRTDGREGADTEQLQASPNLVGEVLRRGTGWSADITPGCADEFRAWLLGQLGENTTRRHCGRCKQFFRAAFRKRLIADNPFGDMKACSVQANRERDYFVSREETTKVLHACPDAQWRLIFALSRFGGLRCPSEHLALRLEDVDWERERIRVRSPKTEHHEGGAERIIPLFPELRPYLEEVWHQASPGTEYFITRYRDTNANLRTQSAEDHPAGRLGAVAQAVPESAKHAGNGTRPRVPDARGLRMDRQQPAGGHAALSAGDGSGL